MVGRPQVANFVVNASVFIQCVALTTGKSTYPSRALPAELHDGDEDEAEQPLPSYEGLSAKLLKQLLDQRAIDRSRCLEKADLIFKLRRADAAEAKAAATAEAAEAKAAAAAAEAFAAAATSLEPEPEGSPGRSSLGEVGAANLSRLPPFTP